MYCLYLASFYSDQLSNENKGAGDFTVNWSGSGARAGEQWSGSGDGHGIIVVFGMGVVLVPLGIKHLSHSRLGIKVTTTWGR